MQYNDFIGQVQSRGRMDSQAAAVKATRATLETLTERLAENQPKHLGAQLPEEIANYLGETGQGESFSVQEFYDRVAKREKVETTDAQFHARAVIDVIRDAITEGELDHVRGQLPDEYAPLFEKVEPNE
ncbi:DUF2267 domain-containing protein [candidate division GN15 bacterium]|nr:DUF2267 domain-containing protein [candidate division GN15 bacterium]